MFFPPGSLNLDLNAMPKPKKKASQVKETDIPYPENEKQPALHSLFEMKRVKGWFPCIDDTTGERLIGVSIPQMLCIKYKSEGSNRKWLNLAAIVISRRKQSYG